jgi:hypothetical protein
MAILKNGIICRTKEPGSMISASAMGIYGLLGWRNAALVVCVFDKNIKITP